MGKILYLLGTRTYWAAIHLAVVFSPKASLFVAGRRQWRQHLAAGLGNWQGKTVWFHCASLGEFEQARPLIERFKKEYPAWKILLTFFSPSGYEVRKDYGQADLILYLPFDTSGDARDFMRMAKPDLAIFIKYEFWYYFLREVHQRQIPLLLVSGIFRPGQLFFKPIGGFYRKMLGFFTHFFLQDERSARLLAQLGLQNLTISGDTRYDRVREIYEQRRPIPIAEQFRDGQPTLVAGSTWPEDIAVLSEAIATLKPPLKLIIAPHEISEAQIGRILKAFPQRQALRFSEATPEKTKEAGLLIIDNIGMLSSLYQYGDLAYVGGAFAQGLHNTLEAATYGIPVFFGKEYSKYQEAIDLVEKGGGFSVRDSGQLAALLDEMIGQPPKRERAGEAAGQCVRKNTGAAQQVMDWLAKHIEPGNPVG